MSSIKVAFGYRCGVGKNTATEIMKENFGGIEVSFASPIYKILHHAQEVCGFTKEKDRKFLQWVGTNWARAKESNVWIRLALESCDGYDQCYISDLRFRNEFDALKADGWTLVKLVRPSVSTDRIGSGSSNHISETALDSLSDSEWDHVVVNDGTVADLEVKLMKIFGDLPRDLSIGKPQNIGLDSFKAIGWPFEACLRNEGEWKVSSTVGSNITIDDYEKFFDTNNYLEVYYCSSNCETEWSNDNQWKFVAKSVDGAYVMFDAGCVYSGFDCQGGGELEVCYGSWEHFYKYGLTDEFRRLLQNPGAK